MDAKVLGEDTISTPGAIPENEPPPASPPIVHETWVAWSEPGMLSPLPTCTELLRPQQ